MECCRNSRSYPTQSGCRLDNKLPSHNSAVAGFVVLTATLTKFKVFCDVTQYPRISDYSVMLLVTSYTMAPLNPHTASQLMSGHVTVFAKLISLSLNV